LTPNDTNGIIGTTDFANDQEMISGDTLGGANPPKHSWTNSKGKKIISTSPPKTLK